MLCFLRCLMLAGFAWLILQPSSFILAGEAHQSTEFDVEASPAAVREFLESHQAELYTCGGAELVATKGNKFRLRQEADGHVYDVVFQTTGGGRIGEADRAVPGGTGGAASSAAPMAAEYVAKVIHINRGPLVSEEVRITLASSPQPLASLCHVSISSEAEVADVAPAKIAIGLRRSIRGMRKLLEQRFPGE